MIKLKQHHILDNLCEPRPILSIIIMEIGGFSSYEK